MEDGHDTSCTYAKCAHPESSEPCPFVKSVNVSPDEPWKDWEPKIVSYPEPEHEHQHTIPVEWVQIPNGSDGYGERTRMSSGWPYTQRVTKLRCVCGDEIERKPITP